MNTEGIKLLYEYNDWADAKIMASVDKITAEQLDAPTTATGVGYASLRNTLVHQMDATSMWRMVFSGYYTDHKTQEQWDANELREADYKTLQSIKEQWAQERQKMWDYINTLSDDKVAGMVRYVLPSGTARERVLWHCLYHFVNHATQHRAEAAALLTSYGQSPGDFDFTLFLNERGKLPD